MCIWKILSRSVDAGAHPCRAAESRELVALAGGHPHRHRDGVFAGSDRLCALATPGAAALGGGLRQCHDETLPRLPTSSEMSAALACSSVA